MNRADALDLADALMGEGVGHYNGGNIEAALVEFRKALAIQERLAPDSLTIATTYNNIGSVLQDQGDLEAVGTIGGVQLAP